MMIKVMIFVLLGNSAFAECDLPTQIAKGTASPCDGYVISSKTEQQIRTDLVYKNSLIENITKQNKLQEDIIRIDAAQLQIYQNKVDNTTFEKSMYFTLGAVLTGIIAFGIARTLK